MLYSVRSINKGLVSGKPWVFLISRERNRKNTYRQPHADITGVMPPLFIYRFLGFLRVLVVPLKNVSPLHADLPLIILGPVLHFGDVDQLDATTSHGGPDVTRSVVSLDGQSNGSAALRLSVALHHLDHTKQFSLRKGCCFWCPTRQPSAQRVKVRTFSARGAEPTSMSLRRPPIPSCTFLKTSMSQKLLLRTMPLQPILSRCV